MENLFDIQAQVVVFIGGTRGLAVKSGIFRPEGERVQACVEREPDRDGHPHADIPPSDGGRGKRFDSQLQFHIKMKSFLMAMGMVTMSLFAHSQVTVRGGGRFSPWPFQARPQRRYSFDN